MPLHGDSYQINSTFPSRSKSAPTLWDNGGTHGLAWDAVYTRRFSFVSPHEDYRTPAGHGRGITLPHSNITHYLAGPCDDSAVDYAAMAVLEITNLTLPYWFVHDHYWRVDPLWGFGTHSTNEDRNFKRLGWGNGTYPESDLFNYLSFVASDSVTGLGNWEDADAKPLQYILQGTGGGGFLEPGGDNVSYSDTMNCNPCEGWIKEAMAIRVSGTSGQAQFHLYTDQGGTGYKSLYALSGGSTRWDTMSGTTRTINPNGTSFVRDTGSNNWVYDVDIYVDLDTTPARIYFTDNATFTSSTIFEIQPYSAWSTTQVTVTVNQGKLPNGTAHVHLRDENAGHSYIGTVTLGSAGFSGARNSFMRL